MQRDRRPAAGAEAERARRGDPTAKRPPHAAPVQDSESRSLPLAVTGLRGCGLTLTTGSGGGSGAGGVAIGVAVGSGVTVGLAAGSSTRYEQLTSSCARPCPRRVLAVNVPARAVSSTIVPSAGPAIPESVSVAVQLADAAEPAASGSGHVIEPVGGDLSIAIGPTPAV